MQRRLAAMLAADVVGYSRLMGADEMGTHTSLKSHRRELIDASISEHHARTVRNIGDGMLVEFASVVVRSPVRSRFSAAWSDGTLVSLRKNKSSFE
jgi:class 3 adenylate cyclase